MFIPTWAIILLSGLIIYAHYTAKKKERGCAPFCIRIHPNWYQLLSDYKLIDDESWEEIRSKFSDEAAHEYNVLTDGIILTVLKSDEESELVYNNKRHYFHTEVDIRERIKEIELKWGKEKELTYKGLPDYSPCICIKWGREGYRICITTPASFEKVVMAGDDNDLIDITTIPYGLFHMPRYRYGVLKPEELTALLKKYGWTEEERDEDYDFIGLPYQLEHKYFTVIYDYI